MKLYFPILLFAVLFMAIGCNDSSTDTDDSTNEITGNALAIRAVNTGSGNLEISQDSEATTIFCYKSTSCGEAQGGGGSFHTIFEDSESLIDYSEDERQAKGVKIAFHVDEGSGYFEVISGRSYRDDAGFLEFEEGDVLYTSEAFSAGDVVVDSYGNTD
ncbi:MAG: hypothetical protein FH748_09745 [Balneolaceae bacterium]|nr:hypothetical protein [Balneolaceae bacterium]